MAGRRGGRRHRAAGIINRGKFFGQGSGADRRFMGYHLALETKGQLHPVMPVGEIATGGGFGFGFSLMGIGFGFGLSLTGLGTTREESALRSTVHAHLTGEEFRAGARSFGISFGIGPPPAGSVGDQGARLAELPLRRHEDGGTGKADALSAHDNRVLDKVCVY
jgi:hypothetical protein